MEGCLLLLKLGNYGSIGLAEHLVASSSIAPPGVHVLGLERFLPQVEHFHVLSQCQVQHRVHASFDLGKGTLSLSQSWTSEALSTQLGSHQMDESISLHFGEFLVDLANFFVVEL